MDMTTQLYQLPIDHGSNTINTARSQHQVQSSVRYQEECIENSLHVPVTTKEEKANHAIIGKTSKPRIKSHTQKTYIQATAYITSVIYFLTNSTECLQSIIVMYRNMVVNSSPLQV